MLCVVHVWSTGSLPVLLRSKVSCPNLVRVIAIRFLLCILPYSNTPDIPSPISVYRDIEPRYLKCEDPGEVPEAQDANLTSRMHTLVDSYIRTEVFGFRCHRPELSAPNNMHCADCAPHSITLYSNTQLT